MNKKNNDNTGCGWVILYLIGAGMFYYVFYVTNGWPQQESLILAALWPFTMIHALLHGVMLAVGI